MHAFAPPALDGWSTVCSLMQAFTGAGMACHQLVVGSGDDHRFALLLLPQKGRMMATFPEEESEASGVEGEAEAGKLGERYPD